MSYGDWADDPSPYLDRDDPRCRAHTSELETNCRLCRSEAIADHEREPENSPAAAFADRPKRLAPVIRPHPSGGAVTSNMIHESSYDAPTRRVRRNRSTP